VDLVHAIQPEPEFHPVNCPHPRFLLHCREEDALSVEVHPIAASTLRSLEYRLVLQCPLATVFSIYTDTERWCNRGSVDDLQWVHGIPWQEGSRIRVKIKEPLPLVVDQVLVHFEPDREIAYTSHVFGMTFHTRLTFSVLSARETEIQIRMEAVGTSWRLFGFAIEPAIEKNTLRFFDDLKRDCEWAEFQAEKSRPTVESPFRGGIH
jgi:hypothetical protein